jgi:release factor glutamine methyltransferase
VKVFAVDISTVALEIAQRNASHHGVLDRIEFVECDGLSGLPAGCRFDLVVANPPYIPTQAIPMLDPEVRDFDPRVALDGGTDGLDFYRRLSVEAPPFCQPDGPLMVEFGDEQEPAVRQIFEETGWTVERVLPDLAGKPRILIARRAGS